MCVHAPRVCVSRLSSVSVCICYNIYNIRLLKPAGIFQAHRDGRLLVQVHAHLPLQRLDAQLLPQGVLLVEVGPDGATV